MKTDNELIAEFMGMKSEIINRNELIYRFENLEVFPEHLGYDTSWEWLIPVCSKFSSLEFTDQKRFDEHSNHCASIAEGILTWEIANAYDTLVNGLKWYNENKTKPV